MLRFQRVPKTLTGTITTDGTITSSTTPYLSTSNIINWTFSLSDLSVILSYTSPGANFGVVGTALTASSSQLFFDFSNLDNEIYFEQPNFPPYPVFTQLYMQGPTSNFGGVPSIAFHYCDPTCYGEGQVQSTGVATIATAVPSAVPIHPSPAAQFITGLALLGLLLWRRKRNGAAIAA
jgi:hypothetical protein